MPALYPKAKAIRAAAWARKDCRGYGLPEGSVPWQVFIRLHQIPCDYCGLTPSGGTDHVQPLFRGGLNVVENLAPCCRRCNESKGARTPAEWRAAQAPYPCASCPTLIVPKPGKPRNVFCAPCARAFNLRQLAAARLNSPIAKPS